MNSGFDVKSALSGLRSSDTAWRIFVINGPNMPNLGRRDKSVYGPLESLEALEEQIAGYGEALGVRLDFFASNYDGKILEHIHHTAADADAYLINPAGMTSVCEAARHALTETRKPVVEVHFSNFVATGLRSVFARSMIGFAMGFREYSYLAGLVGLVLSLDDKTFLGEAAEPGPWNRPDGTPAVLA